MTAPQSSPPSFTTDCLKCGAPMPLHDGKLGGSGAIGQMSFKITAYRCAQCGKWNDLKRRKGYPKKSDAAPPSSGRMEK